MTMLRVMDTGLRAAHANLALTEALLRAHQAGAAPETLRFQHFPPAAIIGRHQSLAREVDLDWCAAHGVETARRLTGGGAITMGDGILGWELHLARSRFPAGLAEAAATLCTGLARGLADAFGIAAEFRPRNDIVVAGRKLCGTGGYFDGAVLLLQGTVLIAPDLALMGHALRLPLGKHEAAGRGGFADRLVGLAELVGAPVAAAAVSAAVTHGIAAALGATPIPGAPTAAEAVAANALAATLGSTAFIYGTDLAPPADGALYAASRLATPAAEIHVQLRLRPGPERRIAEALITGDLFVTPPTAIRDLEAALVDVPLAEAAATAARALAEIRAELLGGDVARLAQAVGQAA